MEPTYQQQPPNGQNTGVDYLNTIAPQAPVKTINPFVLWGAIIGALLLVVLTVAGLANSGTSTDTLLARVGATTNNLKELTDDAADSMQSSELRSINSNLSITLANTNRDLAEPLAAKKISLENTKKNKTVAEVALEYSEIQERLEDARLNGLYDRTYTREIIYQLKTLNSYMGQLYESTNSEDLKTILNSNNENLTVLLEELETLTND